MAARSNVAKKIHHAPNKENFVETTERAWATEWDRKGSQHREKNKDEN